MTIGTRVFLSALIALGFCGCTEPAQYDEGRRETLRSEILNEERSLTVHLPEGYDDDPSATHPVVVALDAPLLAVVAAGVAADLKRAGVIPGVIVVGVVNPGGGRHRDLTPPFLLQDLRTPGSPLGQADRLLAHLRDELLPWISRRFRTDGTFVLAGWSRGGLFAVWSLMADPELFDARIAFSPGFWREDAAIVPRFAEFFARHADLRSTLYMALGSREDRTVKAGYARALEVFERDAPEGLVWRSDILRGAGHQDTIYEGMPSALSTVLRVD